MNKRAQLKITLGICLLGLFLVTCKQESSKSSLDDKKISIEARTQLLADTLYAARKAQKQIHPFTNRLEIKTIEEGYLIQAELTKRLTGDLGKITGYKIAFATNNAMEKFNLNEPVYGPLFEKQQIKNGGVVNLSDFMQFHIENELAFRINSDIKKQIAHFDALKQYIKSVHLAFDMADGRFDRSSGREPIPDFIAAGGGAHRFLLGNPLRNTGISTDNIQLIMTHNNKVVYKGNSNEAYGDPLRALFWIINDLIEKGKAVKKDMVFLTGKVDAPYVPEGEFAKGLYRGTSEGFPDIECTIK